MDFYSYLCKIIFERNGCDMRRFAIVLLLIAACGMLRAQTVCSGYMYTTGVNQADWIELTSYESITSGSSELIDFGFDFYFMGEYFRRFSYNVQGGVRLDTVYSTIHTAPLMPFAPGALVVSPPMILAAGVCLQYISDSYARYQIVGTPGHRKAVFEWKLAEMGATVSEFCFQTQLSEASGSMQFVYKNMPAAFPHTYMQIGFALDYYDFVVLDGSGAPPQNNRSTYFIYSAFPSYTYLNFTPTVSPLCARPRRPYLARVTQTSADVYWERRSEDSYFIVKWGIDAGPRQQIITSDTLATLTGLQPGTVYQVDVYAVCHNGSTSIPHRVNLRTFCSDQNDLFFDYFNLYSPNVECRYGKTYNPSRYEGVVDSGQYSQGSRHTVCTDTSERVAATGFQMRAIPEGYCYSVRLGDYLNGSNEEDITYRLRVDTNDFSLLVLRYAMALQNPWHSPNEQPRFEIDITDSNGTPLSDCYDITFISGQGDEWNSYAGYLWQDWKSVGMDLSPYHGEVVKIRLANYDCSEGAHLGFAFFVMESGRKLIRSDNCSGETNNTFYAPKGFSYRWYRKNDPTVTISTDDSLVVNDLDEYCCYVYFGVAGSDCGFLLPTCSGPRYPTADFTAVPEDTCSRRVRFVNNSVVARDSARTLLTNIPCEQYLWRFGDGTTSTEVSPAHIFDSAGRFRVTLLAMLADGECVDSTWQYIDRTVIPDTTFDTICVGAQCRFYGQSYTEEGDYHYYDNCHDHVLHLTTYYNYYEEKDTALCQGDSIVMGGVAYNETGTFMDLHPGPGGCDSAFHVALTIRDYPIPEYEIFQTCEGEVFYYTYLPDTLDYSWTMLPATAKPPATDSAGRVIFKPNTRTTYLLHAGFFDEPHCPVVDTIRLNVLEPIEARFRLSPTWLIVGNMEFEARDFSTNASGRRWYVDSVLQDETGPVLNYEAVPNRDSVVVMMEAFNNSCLDTAEQTLPIYRYALSFPNIFTPSLGTNNLFGPQGNGVSEYELWIYDRRGDLVFHTDDFDEPWDGTHGGQPCKQDIYVYTCRFLTSDGARKTLTGTISLIR